MYLLRSLTQHVPTFYTIQYNSSSTATSLRNVTAISKLTFEQPNVDLILTVNRLLVSVVIHCIVIVIVIVIVLSTPLHYTIDTHRKVLI